MKILLISPKAKVNEAVKSVTGFRIAQMSLAQVAACLPPDVEIELVDELIRPAPLDTDADLIGISVMTEVVERAYEIADEYRRRGKSVIMGGIHPTLLPQEALQHCDAVVVGEAEGQMEKLVEDFRAHRMRGIYARESLADLKGLPWPRRDLLDRSNYRTINCVQVSRGCPNQCDFCIVPVVHGRKYRSRPVDDVLAEIDSLDGRELFFVDDNLAGNRKHALEFFKALASRNRLFVGQLSATALKDEEMLRTLRRAGGVGFFIGLESISQNTLDSVGKRQKAAEYIDSIKRLHDHGMTMAGAFVFGLDSDDLDVFERTIEFVDKSEIDIVQFTLLTPFPSTPIYDRFSQDGRLVDPQWWLTSAWNHVPFQPLRFSREELREKWIWALKETYRLPRVFKRTTRLLHRRSFPANLITYRANLAYREGLAF